MQPRSAATAREGTPGRLRAIPAFAVPVVVLIASAHFQSSSQPCKPFRPSHACKFSIHYSRINRSGGRYGNDLL